MYINETDTDSIGRKRRNTMSEEQMQEEATTAYVSELLEQNPDIKPASLYNRFVAGLKNKKSPIYGKAFPLRRTEKDSKFKLAKASVREGAKPNRLVFDFLVLDLEAFAEWLEGERETLRNSTRLRGGGSQMVMPSKKELESGAFSFEQLEKLATHVAEKRYGVDRTKKAPKKAAAKAEKPAAKKKKKTAEPAEDDSEE